MKNQVLIIAIVILIQLNPSLCALADNVHQNSEVICDSREEFLIKAGVIEEHFLDKDYFTRSDMAKIACRILYAYPEEKNFTHRDREELADIVYDMPKERDDYIYFSNMYIDSSYGRPTTMFVYLPYIQGDGSYLRPDDLITWEEFVTICIRLLNWDIYIYINNKNKYSEANMDFPDAYFDISKQIGLSHFKREGYVTTSDACDFLYYLIQAPIIGYNNGFTLPINVRYSQFDVSVMNQAGDIVKIHISNIEEENRIKEEYKISEKISFVGKDVLFFYDVLCDRVTAIKLNDNFRFKGEENGLPKEMYGDTIG